ncbi:MAG TPA: class E sortase [Friedmanniella sp.]
MTTRTGDPRHRVRPRRRRRRRPAALTVLGVVLLVAGLSCLGYVGYEYLGTDVVSQRSLDRETGGLHEQWRTASPAARSEAPTATGTQTATGAQPVTQVPGSALALLRVPRFGDDFEVPIVAGTALADLSRGVGHYDGTADAGQIGNFAVAGHRITHGQPFAKLLTLRKGDRVVVETRQAVFTYVMDTSPADLTVEEDAGWVLDPVPDHPDATPTQAMITLTTCQDLFHSPDRSVGFGHLETTRDK